MTFSLGVESNVNAGICASKQAPVQKFQQCEQQSETTIESLSSSGPFESTVQQFKERKIQSLSGAILEIQNPNPELVEYLVLNHQTLVNELIKESVLSMYRLQSSLRDSQVSISDEKHLLASFLTSYFIDLSATWNAIRGPTLDAVKNSVIESVNSVAEIEVKAVTERSDLLAVRDAAYIVPDAITYESDTWEFIWHQSWNDVQIFSIWLSSKRAAAKASRPWVTSCLRSIVHLPPTEIATQAVKITELFTMAWMLENGTEYKREIYPLILSHIRFEMRYENLLSDIAAHTWNHLELRGNPISEGLRAQYEFHRERTRKVQLFGALCSIYSVKRLGNNSGIRILPKELIRRLDQFLF